MPSEIQLFSRWAHSTLGRVYRTLHPLHHRNHKVARKMLDDDPRAMVAKRHLRGRGIEIGALHRPLTVPWHARVMYVDRMSLAELHEAYPELKGQKITVDVADDGEGLHKFAKDSQDFIIANHFLEHAQDPVGTIKRHLEVVRKGGCLFMAVPDKDFTFDKNRPLTTLDHLERDFREGPKWSYDDHVEEYVKIVELGQPGNGHEERVQVVKETQMSIHFHVWDKDSLAKFMEALPTRFGLPVRVREYVPNPPLGENIVVLERT